MSADNGEYLIPTDFFEKLKTDVKDAQCAMFSDYASDADILKIKEHILDFISVKKRKIYGGFALDSLIKSKNGGSIYQSGDKIDIDVYSPNPLQDVFDICNSLYSKGFRFIKSQEAQHFETYTIHVCNVLFCNITYVPTNIYHHIPFQNHSNILLVHPHFMIIDYLRIFTDPLQSFWRLDKCYPRFRKLLEVFPFKDNGVSLYIDPPDSEMQTVFSEVKNFLIDNKTVIVLGYYAYNYYMNQAEHQHNIIEMPYYEFISIDYKNDTLKLLALLKSKFGDRINHVEYYPFFQFIGNSTEIYFNEELIVKIYHYNDRPTPFIIGDNIVFDRSAAGASAAGASAAGASAAGASAAGAENKIQLGTFYLTLCYMCINIIQTCVCDKSDDKDIYFIMANNLMKARDNFFKNHHLTEFDDSVFKSFQVQTAGCSFSKQYIRQSIMEKRKSKGKVLVFRYIPSDNDQPVPKYIFANSSGRKILNEHHLRLRDGEEDD